MLRVGLLFAALVSSWTSAPQTPVLTTPQRPVTTGWEMTKSLSTGRSMKLRFELRPSSRYIDGPRVIVPCTGPSEEAMLRGWRDDSVQEEKPAADWWIIRVIKSELKVGGQAADQLLLLLTQEQSRIESEITQLYRVQPGEGNGPRAEEQVFKYRYQQMTLYVIIEGRKEPVKLNTFFVPVSTPVLESTRPCTAAPTETAASVGSIGTILRDMVTETPLPGVDRREIGYIGAVFAPEMAGMLSESKFEAVGVDINTATFREPDFSLVPTLKWIYLPSGTVLVPGKGGIQSMITVDPMFFLRSSFSSGERLERSVAVHCLEIEKDPPNSMTRFTLSRTNDPILRNLALMTNRSAIRGPWDQTRIWIYSDKASLERVNKRLAIGCPPGMYMRSLWEVHSMGGFSDKDLANKELFDPTLLGGVSNRKEAAGWFTSVLASRHRPALTAYLDSGAKEFADLITSPNPLAGDQLLRTIGLLMNSEHPDVRMAVLLFLDKQDAAALKKVIGRPLLKWEGHLERGGPEADLAGKLKAKLG